MGAGEGEDGFGLGEGSAGGGFGLAAGVGVDDKKGGGAVHDEAVALRGQRLRYSHLRVVEGRDQQQAALGQRVLPGGLGPHAADAAGRADDDRLITAQQDVQAVLLNGGVEAADQGNTGVTQGLRGVVGLEDQVAGTAAGAEEGGQRLVEQGGVTLDASLTRGYANSYT